MHPLRPAFVPALLALLAACAQDPPPAESEFASILQQVEIPANLAAGEAVFNENCAVCHGGRGLGTSQGPPLVHIIYEPNHHADIAFYMAVDRGVRAHHWRFGDMAPLPNVSNEEVGQIVEYVRFLQRQVGIR
ncbi:MAG TPA: cytochrome c [Longimicrobiaceae bacterium]|nr:cytochrome c [Longimicrobiaceae bacterium]